MTVVPYFVSKVFRSINYKIIKIRGSLSVTGRSLPAEVSEVLNAIFAWIDFR